jgi:hypothetical protein
MPPRSIPPNLVGLKQNTSPSPTFLSHGAWQRFFLHTTRIVVGSISHSTTTRPNFLWKNIFRFYLHPYRSHPTYHSVCFLVTPWRSGAIDLGSSIEEWWWGSKSEKKSQLLLTSYTQLHLRWGATWCYIATCVFEGGRLHAPEFFWFLIRYKSFPTTTFSASLSSLHENDPTTTITTTSSPRPDTSRFSTSRISYHLVSYLALPYVVWWLELTRIWVWSDEKFTQDNRELVDRCVLTWEWDDLMLARRWSSLPFSGPPFALIICCFVVFFYNFLFLWDLIIALIEILQ